MNIALGSETGSVAFSGPRTILHGALNIDLGGGGSASFGVRNNIQVTGGAGNDTLGFSGRTSIGQSLSFLGDVGDDILTAAGSRLAVRSATGTDGGVGARTFDVIVTSLALASLTVTGGSLNDTVSIIADGAIAGDVNLQLGADGAGPSSTTLQSHAGLANGLKFGGALTVNMTGATVDFLTIANLQVAKAFVA